MFLSDPVSKNQGLKRYVSEYLERQLLARPLSMPGNTICRYISYVPAF